MAGFKSRILKKRQDQRGAALVESAIVILPLCIILFGIVEFGFVFKDSLTISSATRAGARTASAAPNSTSFMDVTKNATAQAATAAQFRDNDVMFIYKAGTGGLPESGNRDQCTTNCVKYVYNNGSWNAAGGSWPPASQQACLGGTIDSVGVSLQLTHKSITGFFPFVNNMQLRERTVMRLEPTTDDC